MKKIMHCVSAIAAVICTINTAKTVAQSKEKLDDPIIQTIELTLDLENSSESIVSTLSSDRKATEESMPTMKVDLYQSGKRVMTGQGELPAWNLEKSTSQKIEFMYIADVEEQVFSLSEVSDETKQKIAEKNPDLTALTKSESQQGKNQAFYDSLQPETQLLNKSSAGYFYPSTYVTITAVDPPMVILARTHLRVNGLSDGSRIIWCNSNYYHQWKLAGGYDWPLDTTWFRDSGSINWPTPNSWTSIGYEASTKAAYGNWDWRRDDKKTNVIHNIYFRVMPSGVTKFKYTHEDSGEDHGLIRGLFGAATYF